MTLDELIDRTWVAMAPAPFRRAFLGSRAVSELVMLAALHFPEASLVAVLGDRKAERRVVLDWERAVLDGFVLRRNQLYAATVDRRGWSTWWKVCIPWGAFVVVRYLLELWRDGQIDVVEMHERCGWRRRKTGTGDAV